MSIRTALENRLERLNNNDKGFTLIELLVVVIIIGILAAIAVPVFLSQQATAEDSRAQANLSTAKTAYVSYLVRTPAGASPTSEAFTEPALTALTGFGWPGTVVSAVRGGTSANFCFQAPGGNGGTWHVTGATPSPVNTACPVP